MRGGRGRDKLVCVGGPFDGERVLIAIGCRELVAPGGRYVRIRFRRRPRWGWRRTEFLQWVKD